MGVVVGPGFRGGRGRGGGSPALACGRERKQWLARGLGRFPGPGGPGQCADRLYAHGLCSKELLPTGSRQRAVCQRDPASGLGAKKLGDDELPFRQRGECPRAGSRQAPANGLGDDGLPRASWVPTGSRQRAMHRRASASGLGDDGLPPAGWATPDSRRRARCGRAPSNGLCVGEFPPTGDGAPALSPPNSDRQEAWGSAG